MPSKCPNGHDRSWKCHKPPPTTCVKCENKAKADAEKQRKAFARQQQMDADQQEHARRIAEIDEQVAAERQKLRDIQLAQERARAIREKEKDLENSISLAARAVRSPLSSQQDTTSITAPLPALPQNATEPNAHPASGPSEPESFFEEAAQVSSQPLPKSSSQEEWEHLKNVEGASNDAIDCIMELIGLEEVKSQVLSIKSKIDVTKRQNTSLKDERFNIVLLGNPGTGIFTLLSPINNGSLTTVIFIRENHNCSTLR